MRTPSIEYLPSPSLRQPIPLRLSGGGKVLPAHRAGLEAPLQAAQAEEVGVVGAGHNGGDGRRAHLQEADGTLQLVGDGGEGGGRCHGKAVLV